MTYSGVVVIRISQPRRHDLELQLSWDHQSQPQTCPPPPRRCNTRWLSRILPTWPAGPMAIVNTIVRVGVSSSVRHDDGDMRYRSVGGEWLVKHQRFFCFSLSCGGALVLCLTRSLGFSLGLSLVYGRSWLRHPIHFILIEDQVHIYVMHFSTSYCG